MQCDPLFTLTKHRQTNKHLDKQQEAKRTHSKTRSFLYFQLVDLNCRVDSLGTLRRWWNLAIPVECTVWPNNHSNQLNYSISYSGITSCSMYYPSRIQINEGQKSKDLSFSVVINHKLRNIWKFTSIMVTLIWINISSKQRGLIVQREAILNWQLCGQKP